MWCILLLVSYNALHKRPYYETTFRSGKVLNGPLIDMRMFCFTLFHAASSLHAYLVHSKYIPFPPHWRAPKSMTINFLCSASRKWSAGTYTAKPSWKGVLA